MRLYRQALRRTGKRDEEPRNTAVLKKRISRMFNMLILRMGGSSNAVETTISIFSYILDNNRYIGSDVRKRKIVYRLYRHYF